MKISELKNLLGHHIYYCPHEQLVDWITRCEVVHFANLIVGSGGYSVLQLSHIRHIRPSRRKQKP